MVRIGIDIGGTKVNMGILSEKGEVISRRKLETRSAADPRALVEQIAEGLQAMLLDQALSLSDVSFIGAGVPGTVDYHTGLVSYCPNVQWFDVPMGDYFREKLGREVIIFQDSRNGALAEKLFGAGRNYSDLICITIGTGIGCGIVMGGKVLHGALNTAGELGHTPIIKDGRSCLCGNKGCLEQYVCGPAIGRRAAEAYPEKFLHREKKCETVFELAYEGDKEMLALIDEAMDDLACGIANAVNLLSPEAIIISGGLSEHEKLVIGALREKIPAHGYYAWTRQKRLAVLKAELGSDAPMIGAAFIDYGL